MLIVRVKGDDTFKMLDTGTSLAVQWLRLRASTAGGTVRFCMSRGAAKKKQQKKHA